MFSGLQRTRSQNRKHNRNFSHSENSMTQSWHQDPVPRPATAYEYPGVNHDPTQPTLPPARSRSRLRKRPSQAASNRSTSTSAMSRTKSSDYEDMTALPQLPAQVLPPRSSSLRKKKALSEPPEHPSSKHALPEEQKRPGRTTQGSLAMRTRTSRSHPELKIDSHIAGSTSSSGSPQSPTTLAVPRTPRHQPLAPYDPSPLNPAYHIPSSYFSPRASTEPTRPEMISPNPNDKTNAAPIVQPTIDKHVALPPGFRPGKTEHTEVDEVVKPVVTHEVIKHNKKEIIKQQITREIHVHHYYTYTQPIKAVEILPARHFIVDVETGEKVEIPTPEGWAMPPNLAPYTPDTSILAPVSRHYLVNEEHPNGVMEPPPLPPTTRNKRSQQELRKKSSNGGSWTPFPKVR